MRNGRAFYRTTAGRHQAIAEIAADLGASFVLDAVTDALGQAARTEIGVGAITT